MQMVDGGPTVPVEEEEESLRFALVTMGAMPEMAPSMGFIDLEENFHEIKFTKRGVLAPPETLSEVSGRLRELWVQTAKLANGTMPRQIHIMHDQNALRARLFYRVGARIAQESA